MKQITSIATNAKSVYSNFNKFEVRCDKRKRRRPGKNTNILSLLWDWLANINLDAFSQLPIFSEYSFPFNIPTGRQSGPKVFVVKYAERRNLIPPPQFRGRLTVRHAVGGMERDDGRSEGHPVMGWIRVESQSLTLPDP